MAILVIIGAILAFIGGIMVLIQAFKESILWGLGSLILPIVQLIFVITHWNEAKSGFLLQIVGVVLVIMGGGLSHR